MAAMRANDLHCGRGSSPLRTKLKKSPRKSPKRSPRNQNLYNQLMRSTSKISIFDGSSTQRSGDLNSISKTMSPVKFKRRCKVSEQTSPEKLNKEEILGQERRKILDRYKETIKTVNEDFNDGFTQTYSLKR